MVSEKIFSIRYFKNLSDFGIFKLYLKPFRIFFGGARTNFGWAIAPP